MAVVRTTIVIPSKVYFWNGDVASNVVQFSVVVAAAVVAISISAVVFKVVGSNVDVFNILLKL